MDDIGRQIVAPNFAKDVLLAHAIGFGDHSSFTTQLGEAPHPRFAARGIERIGFGLQLLNFGVNVRGHATTVVAIGARH